MPRVTPPLAVGAVLATLLLAALVVACGGPAAPPPDAASSARAQAPAGVAPVSVVTTVAPLRNIIENVAGDRASVTGLVPEGMNAHTFQPPPSAARLLAQADLIVLNGLSLELPTLELAQANAPASRILLLGENTISEDEYVFDFSFPAADGHPNPHLWTDPTLSARYAALVRDALSRIDPAAADYYDDNFARFRDQLAALDSAIARTTATIPPRSRKLLTYHDSFPFFGRRYGFEIIGAIQPSDFSEPSPREVAALVAQIRDAAVPAIFGSEVFPSEVLQVIANEAGAVQVSTLSDDDLPGAPGDPNNTLVAMLVENVRTMTTVLGGDPSPLEGFDVANTWRSFAQFREGA